MNSFSPSTKDDSVTYTIEELPTLRYHPEARSEGLGIDQFSASVPVPKYYEDNTYIDWYRESLILPTSSGFQTRKWLTIIISSVCLGYITTFIDLTSVWLNDFKKGLCFSKLDRWSLLDPYSSCPVDDWHNWSKIIFNSTGFALDIFVNFPIYLIFALFWLIIVAYITIEKVPLIKQSGIPEIKLIISGLNYKLAEYLGVRTLIYKIIGLILVVSSGLWLGKEGPLVHVSCCILNIFYSLIIESKFENEAVRRELLSAATATGISVAFNAPIGGVLFVLESMPSFFMPTKIMWNSFITSTVAVVVVTGFKTFTEGENFYEQDLFQVSFGNFSWLFMEIIPFVFLGVLGGFYGHYLTKFNTIFTRHSFRRRVQQALCSTFKVPEKYGNYFELCVLLIITSVLNFPIEISRLPLNAFLKILFTDCPKEAMGSNSSNFMCSPSDGMTALKLFYIIVQGFFLSAYTFGVELPGGILMPSLVLGATSGRLIGIISQAIQKLVSWDSFASCTEKSCIVSPSSYAVIGAGAYMAGITKLTMSVVVILFELTGAITYVLPIMLAVVISKFVNDWLCNDNIYDTWLRNYFNKSGSDGFPNEGKGDGLVSFADLTSGIKQKLPDVTVKSVMIPTSNIKCLCLIPESPYTVDALYNFVNEDTHEGYPLIVNYSNPISLGYVNKQVLCSKLSSMDRSEVTISFQIANLPNTVLSLQLHYERRFTGMLQVELTTEPQLIISNDLTPISLTFESFEKLHLNYLIILDSNNRNSHLMSGFVDRFILANLINEEFESVIAQSVEYNADEYEIEEEHLLNSREERHSIELLT